MLVLYSGKGSSRLKKENAKFFYGCIIASGAKFTLEGNMQIIRNSSPRIGECQCLDIFCFGEMVFSLCVLAIVIYADLSGPCLLPQCSLASCLRVYSACAMEFP